MTWSNLGRYCFDNMPIMKTNPVVAGLAALAHDTRFAVIRLLLRQPESGLSAGQIAATLGVPPGSLSFHLKMLAEAGLLKGQPRGNFIYYVPDVQALDRLLADLREACSLNPAMSAPRGALSTHAVVPSPR